MDRDRKGRLHYIRYTLTVIGTLMLIAALFMLAMISGKDDICYATNGEIADYILNNK